MRFSLFSVLDYYEDGSRSLSMLYAQLLDQIVEAVCLGFEAFWIGEHHGYLTPHLALACPNPAVLLFAAAQRTQRIGLNTAKDLMRWAPRSFAALRMTLGADSSLLA